MDVHPLSTRRCIGSSNRLIISDGRIRLVGFGDKSTFKQRYFVNDDWWKPGSPIFFYFGNEDNVELYVNHTGLMWESAPDFHAMLVFAEHRYWRIHSLRTWNERLYEILHDGASSRRFCISCLRFKIEIRK